MKNFAEEESLEQAEDEKADLKTSDTSTCRLPVSKLLDCSKEAGIYTDKNYTDFSYINRSINPNHLHPTSPPPDGQPLTYRVRTAPFTVLSEQVWHLLNTNAHLLGAPPPNTPPTQIRLTVRRIFRKHDLKISLTVEKCAMEKQ